MGNQPADPNAFDPNAIDPNAQQFDPFSMDPSNPQTIPFGFGGGSASSVNAPTAPQNVVGTPYDPAAQAAEQGNLAQSAQAGGAGQPSAQPQRAQSIADQLQKLLTGINPISQAQAAEMPMPKPPTGAAWDPSPTRGLPNLPPNTLLPPGTAASGGLPNLPPDTLAPPGTPVPQPRPPEAPPFPFPQPRPPEAPQPPAATVDATQPPAATRDATAPVSTTETVPGGTPVRSDKPAPDAVTAAQTQGSRAQQAAQQNRPGSPLHRAIAGLFGGGDLGNLVASLMLQLGVPAALIMAGRGRGGGHGFPLVGGRAAMGGGRGGGRFGPGGRYIGPQPQYGRQLFPGSGVPDWLFPMIAGQVLDAQGRPVDQSQGNPLHPATGLPPEAKTGETPLTLSGGAEEGATPVKTTPYAPQGFTTRRGADMPLPAPKAGPGTTVPAARPGPGLFSPDPMERLPPAPGTAPGSQGPIEASLTSPGAASAYTNALFNIESGGNPKEVTSGNYGLGQFSPDQWQHYGITRANYRDPRVMQRAVMQEANENTRALRPVLGRDPTPAELYIAHQQGLAGAKELLTASPGTPAWQAIRRFYRSDQIAKTAIGNLFDGQRHRNPGNIPHDNPLYNVPVEQVSAQQFTDMWRARFNRAYVQSIQRQQPRAIASAPAARSTAYEGQAGLDRARAIEQPASVGI